MAVIRKGLRIQADEFASLTAGEAVTDGTLCYLKSDGKMWKTDANATGTTEGFLAIAGGTIGADAIGEFMIHGDNTGSSLTKGGAVYVSETAGGVTQTNPATIGAYERIIGYATSTTVWEFTPEQIIPYQETELLVAGEDVAYGDVVYLKSDAKMWKTDADAEATTVGKLAIAGATILADATGTFIIKGKIATTGLTVGAPLYVSPTAGEVTETKSVTSTEWNRLVGYANTSTSYTFDPDNYAIVV